MSNTQQTAEVAKAPRKPLAGLVQRVNEDGVEIDGRWYNYGRIFKGEKLTKEASGSQIELTLVQAKKDGHWFIASIEKLAAKSESKATVETAAPEAKTATAPVPAPEAPAAKASEAQPAKEPKATEDGPSPKQVDYLKGLADELKLSEDTVRQILRLRFGRDLEQLSRGEMRRFVLPFFGAYEQSGK